MKKLTKEQAMKVIDEMTKSSQVDEESQEKAWIDIKKFKRDHPDFGIMCFSDELKTDQEFLKTYIELNHENMEFDEWNKIADLNVSKAMAKENFPMLNFLFSLNKNIAGETEESGLYNTDQLFGMHMNIAEKKFKKSGGKMSLRDKIRFARKFDFKGME